jgi:hypothetical protein
MFPQTPAATAALSVAARFYSSALLNHCVRSYLAGGDLAWLFGVAAGWPADQAARASEIIVPVDAGRAAVL